MQVIGLVTQAADDVSDPRSREIKDRILDLAIDLGKHIQKTLASDDMVVSDIATDPAESVEQNGSAVSDGQQVIRNRILDLCDSQLGQLYYYLFYQMKHLNDEIKAHCEQSREHHAPVFAFLRKLERSSCFDQQSDESWNTFPTKTAEILDEFTSEEIEEAYAFMAEVKIMLEEKRAKSDSGGERQKMHDLVEDLRLGYIYSEQAGECHRRMVDIDTAYQKISAAKLLIFQLFKDS